VSRQGALEDESAFTLIEVIVTIILMGIVFAIASSFWFGLVEDRRVNSATNQMVSELHFAHTSATNRLQSWEVDLRPVDVPPEDRNVSYRVAPLCEDPCAEPPPPPSRLEEGTEFTPGMEGVRVVFQPDGGAEVNGAGNLEIRSAAADGDPCHEIDINEATSRVRVFTNVC
jgi:prepilin-type N-terminal cleavage/methylation domain-containing protein